MQNLHLTFDWYYIGQSKVEISQNFVAFSEYMNFKPDGHRYGAEATNKDIMRKLGQGILPTAHNSARAAGQVPNNNAMV